MKQTKMMTKEKAASNSELYRHKALTGETSSKGEFETPEAAAAAWNSRKFMNTPTQTKSPDKAAGIDSGVRSRRFVVTIKDPRDGKITGHHMSLYQMTECIRALDICPALGIFVSANEAEPITP